ncbi:MAG: flagellar basal body-associated FliL family protein [Rhodothermales bacterium]|nr:flagellar basal body-associated FliL family protein [Rhodothermales bacterium]
MILLPILLVSAGGGAYLSYANYPTIAQMVYNFGIEEEGSAEEEAGGEDAGIQYGEFLELTDIIVNPADSNGRRLLMVSLGIESIEPTLLESITAREMVVRDTIIKILGRRTVEDLAAIEQRNVIKGELLQAVNGVLTEGQISRLYFTQYVLQ